MATRRSGTPLWLRLVLGALVIVVGFGLGAAAMLFVALGRPAAAAPRVLVVDSESRIAWLALSDGVVTKVGQAAAPLTDIAVAPNGRVFALSFTRLYAVGPAAELTDLGAHGVPCGNALEIAPDGSAYAMGCAESALFQLDLEGGQARRLMTVNHISSGDLAWAGDRLLLAALGDGDDLLVSVDPRTGAVEVIGSFGIGSVFGLAVGADGAVYAGAGTDYYRVDPSTAQAVRLGGVEGSGLGAAFGWATDGALAALVSERRAP